MKHIFQIPIFMLMLWASGVGYAAHSVVYHSPEKETVSAIRPSAPYSYQINGTGNQGTTINQTSTSGGINL